VIPEPLLDHYAELCRLAYEPDAIQQFEFLNYIVEVLPTSSNEQVYKLTHFGTTAIVIAGTNQPSDWLINLLAMPMGGTWDVHPGYAAIAVALAPQIRAIETPGSLTVIGHSKGGAIAALLGAILGCQAVSFGSPRVGSQRFADHCPASVLYSRVIRPFDIVARLPSRIVGYRHCGSAIVRDGDEYMFGNEVWELYKARFPFRALALRLGRSVKEHFRYWA
jgi:Lipase (class 3)